MMRVTDLMVLLEAVYEEYGNVVINTVNEETGEIRYIDGAAATGYELTLTHTDYGTAIAEDDEDDEFFIVEVDASMTTEEFLQTLALLGLCDDCKSCDSCTHSNQFTLDDVASCNCCEDYSYYTPKSRY
jgi:hypothetical protein